MGRGDARGDEWWGIDGGRDEGGEIVGGLREELNRGDKKGGQLSWEQGGGGGKEEAK